MLHRFVMTALLISQCVSASALPKWTRQYGMPCGGCHSVPPRLNDFGRAFQANNFTIPGTQLSIHKGILPISGIATFSAERDFSTSKSNDAFRNLKLFVVDPIFLGGNRSGVYYANPIAFSNDPSRRSGSLEDVYLTLPVSGSRGQWTATVGQWMPIINQWSGHNVFTRATPLAFQLGIGGFSFAGHSPGVRVDYFDQRGKGTADGNYFALGIPFSGRLDIYEGARVGGVNGIFAHTFRRQSGMSVGGFAYARGRDRVGGFIWTREIGAKLALWGIAALGESSTGPTRRASLEADRYFGGRLAFTGRLDWINDAGSELSSTAAVTFFPFKEPIVRATLELTKRRGERTFAFLARGLF